MQSSTTVACRVGVMLVCLIAIPLAALFGTKLPGLVSQMLERERDAAGASHEDLRSEALPFNEPAPATSPSGGERPPEWGFSSTASPPAAVEPGHSPQGSASLDRGAAPAPTHYLGDLRGSSRPQLVPVSVGREAESAVAISPAVFESNASPLVRVAPSDWREDSARARVALVSAGSPGGDQASASPSFVETPQSKDVQRRLRELGASYYALETWGARGEYYRFQARMAAGNGAGYVRHFDAIDRDAARAMASVLDQVERWRAAQGHQGSAFSLEGGNEG